MYKQLYINRWYTFAINVLLELEKSFAFLSFLPQILATFNRVSATCAQTTQVILYSGLEVLIEVQ